MTCDGILKHIKTENVNLLVYDEVTSTNTLLKEMVQKNAALNKAVIIANSQTAGRGRYNRSFQSDKGGIYLSILLRPTANFNPALLTAAVAVAVSDAIEKISTKQTQIKWVNDILIENKKVCGILCEGVFNGTDSFIIVGIGINATPPQNGFRDEIKAIAGTVFDSAATNDCEKLTAMVIDNVLTQCENIEKCNFLATYRNKNIVLGKKVDILKQGEVIDNGTALEIDDQCHLKVELKNGEVVTLSSGEVSVKI